MRKALILAGVMALMFFSAGNAGAIIDTSNMTSYCIQPPYVSTSTPPHIHIIMDNSYINGSYAYGDSKGEPYYDALTFATNKTRFDGPFNPNVRYALDGKEFVPDNGTTMDTNGDGKPGIFDGNMLNWAITSRYDLITSILVGGQGVPTVTANRLRTTATGWVNSGGVYYENWPEKRYRYVGTDNSTNNCRIIVNATAVTIAEYGTLANQRCRLLATPPVFPLGSNYYSKLAEAETSEPVYLASNDLKPAKATDSASPAAAAKPVARPDAKAEPASAPPPTSLAFDASQNRIIQFAREHIEGLMRSMSPDEAWAAPALGILVPSSQSPKVPSYCTDGKQGSTTLYENCIMVTSVVNTPFTYTTNVKSGTGTAPYAWSMVSTYPVPTAGNFNITTNADTSGTLSGTPNDVLTWATFKLTDSKAASVTGVVVINATAAAGGGGGLNQLDIQNFTICASDLTKGYTRNCKTAAAQEDIKTGLVKDYWQKAHFGLIAFQKYDSPTRRSADCPNKTDMTKIFDTDYGNQIVNAQPVGGTCGGTICPTTLIEAENMALEDYITKSAQTCGVIPEVDNAGNPLITPCQKHYILMLTSGEGADKSGSSAPVIAIPAGDAGVMASAICTQSDLLVKNACIGALGDFKNDMTGFQNVLTYVVNIMGNNNDHNNILKATAKYGGGKYFEVTDPKKLRDQLILAFSDMIRKAASGTAASVLASGEGSGANLIQAVYYPKRRFPNTQTDSFDEIAWIGRLTNFWYYVDPFFSNNNIREELSSSNPPILNLIEDPVAELYYNTELYVVRARRIADTNGDGMGDVLLPEKDFESVGNIWEAGSKLWARDLTVSPRTIYMPDVLSSPKTNNFVAFANTTTVTNNINFQSYLGVDNADDAFDIVNFIHGVEVAGMRTRMVKLDLDGDGLTNSVVGSIDESVAKVWKLGDVLNSTPRLTSWVPIHKYDKNYNDDSYKAFVNSSEYTNRGMVFAGGNDGMLHAFNLGTLVLDWIGRNRALEKAMIYDPMPGGKASIGEEAWTFIPASVLPYLKYLTDEAYGGCHLYSVDLSPYIFDASIALDPDTSPPAAGIRDPEDYIRGPKSWRTILIGGMRFGGACKQMAAVCAKDTNGDGAINDLDCVKTPATDKGFSSYFALDITNTTAPKLMWEFTHPDLGYSTTGPVIVRVNGDNPGNDADGNALDKKKLNGKWFVVFGSGPTGPIDTDHKQFRGNSDQNLKLFVFDISKDPMANSGLDLKIIDTGKSNAYAGSMINVTNDLDVDYQDDVFYIGYVKKCAAARDAYGCDVNTSTGSGYWNDGGVLRIVPAAADTPQLALDPNNWAVSTLIENTGPVASSVSRLQDTIKNKLWIFVGTGRYYYMLPDAYYDTKLDRTLSSQQGKSIPDDPIKRRQIMGILDTCFNTKAKPFTDQFCTGRTVDPTSLVDVTSLAHGASSSVGWSITLDDKDTTSGLMTERVITDLLSTTSGLVFVTTFQPYAEECTLGGKSYIWALKYDTGGAAGALLKGTALMQVSTGSIEKIDLGSAFNEKGGRRSGKLEGVPPMAQGFSLFQTPPPVERVLHMIERDR